MGEKFRIGYRALQDSAMGEKLFHYSLSISQNETDISSHNLMGSKSEKTGALGQKHICYSPKDLVHSCNIFLQF